MKICETCQQETERLIKLMCRKCWKKQYRKDHAEEIAVYMAQYREANKDRIAETSRAYRQNNPEKVKEWKARWLKTEKGRAYNNSISRDWYHAGKTQESLKKYREANKDKTALRGQKWRQTFPWKHSAAQAKRRALKVQATPKWFSNKDSIWLELMFAFAKTLEQKTGVQYHIDHIVPLKGRTVCGLHWLENWGILPANENIRKSNFF